MIFQDKMILITGAARRLGALTAVFCASKGYNILLHYNKSYKCACDLQNHICSRYHTDCEIIQADFCNDDSVKSMISKIDKFYSKCNILINNASIFDRISIINTSFEDFNNNVSVHMKAPFFLMQSFVKRCEFSQIINIGDIILKQKYSPYFAYWFSKRGLQDISNALIHEAGHKCLINTINPKKILSDDIIDIDYDNICNYVECKEFFLCLSDILNKRFDNV